MTVLKIYWRLKSLIKVFLFKLLFGKRFIFPTDSTFRKNFGLYLERKAHIKVGHNVFFNRGCSINCLEYVEIGDNCIFGENVKIYDQNHRFKDRDEIIRNQGYSVSPVIIKEGCWICTNAVILKGVTIGEHSVIGAGCVIDKDIPAFSVVKNIASLQIVELRKSS